MCYSVSYCTIVDLLADLVTPDLAADQKFVLWLVQIYENTIALADRDKAAAVIHMTSTLKKLYDEGRNADESVVHQLLDRVTEVRQRIEAPHKK